jgi:hypothetical protein
MTPDDFRQSLTADKPPAGLTLALVGVWWDAMGDWDAGTRVGDKKSSALRSRSSWTEMANGQGCQSFLLPDAVMIAEARM